jgi:GDP-L-fucose synthase
MNKMKVFLTGSGGMVGRNMLAHPGTEQFEMIAPRRGELDLRDFDAVVQCLETYKPDIVIHAAGKVGGIQANMSDPVGFLLENMDMGRNIVWASRTVGIKRVLNLGSSCMYPRNYTDPLTEDMVLKGELEPTNEGYALAKVMTARLCEYITREDASYQYKTLIPCNLYGRFDKFDPSNSHLIPSIIYKLDQARKNGVEHVDIWGDGNVRREFMYAGDFADVLVRAVTDFSSLPSMMNVGLGYDYSINEYYSAAAEVVGYSGGFDHDLSKPVGMFRKLVSVDKQKKWGWEASHTLQEGIEETYRYYLKEYAK